MAMVQLRGVSKTYGSSTALESIDLDIRKGEFLTLLGPSGSGKTTILNLIAGIISPTGGQIMIDGKDATQLPPGMRQLGMVFQNYALMPHMTVFENIAFPLRVRKLSKDVIEQEVNDVLKLVRLPDVGKRKPKELSGGQQQRVSLARCIVYNPALILLDEPLGALDKKLREQMQLEIKRIHSELGITMLNVTHDQEEALTLSDRIVLMNGGKIEQIAKPTELYFAPKTVFAAAFIGDANFFKGVASASGAGTIDIQTDYGVVACAAPSTLTSTGQAMTVLVRPENVELEEAKRSTSMTLFSNQFEGTVMDHLVLGATIKHRVSLPDGKEITVQHVNHPGTRIFARGDAVKLSFEATSALALAR